MEKKKKVVKQISGKQESRTAAAKARYLRISAQKVNNVARQVRGLKLTEAEGCLNFMTKKGAKLILKILKSAAANAVSKSMNRAKLRISRIEVGQGPSLKRGTPVSRGVFHPILKKTSHVLVELAEEVHGTQN